MTDLEPIQIDESESPHEIDPNLFPSLKALLKNSNLSLNDFISQWQSKCNLNELLLLKSYPCKDPLATTMSPHESYVFHLGLNQCFANSFKNLNEATINSLKNREIFLQNLHTINSINKQSTLKIHRCPKCDFHAQSLYEIDEHLIEPHQGFKCNFCPFDAKDKLTYFQHMYQVHKRVYKLAPDRRRNKFCDICEFSCRDNPSLARHKVNCNPDHNKFINANGVHVYQAPSMDDMMDHMFLFPKIQRNNQLSPPKPILRIEIPQKALSTIRQKNNEASDIILPDSIQKTQENKDISPKTIVVNQNKPPKIKVKPIYIPQQQSSNNAKLLLCPLCPVLFETLLAIAVHLRLVHNLDNEASNALIAQHVVPQISQLMMKADAPKAVVVETLAENRRVSNEQQKRVSSQSPVDCERNAAKKMRELLPEPDEVIEVFESRDDELKSVESFLNIDRLDEKLVEVKTLAGKCVRCFGKTQFDIVKHLEQEHKMKFDVNAASFFCLLCEKAFSCRRRFVQHQHFEHFVIYLMSVNKFFTIDRNVNNFGCKSNAKVMEVNLSKSNHGVSSEILSEKISHETANCKVKGKKIMELISSYNDNGKMKGVSENNLATMQQEPKSQSKKIITILSQKNSDEMKNGKDLKIVSVKSIEKNEKMNYPMVTKILSVVNKSSKEPAVVSVENNLSGHSAEEIVEETQASYSANSENSAKDYNCEHCKAIFNDYFKYCQHLGDCKPKETNLLKEALKTVEVPKSSESIEIREPDNKKEISELVQVEEKLQENSEKVVEKRVQDDNKEIPVVNKPVQEEKKEVSIDAEISIKEINSQKKDEEKVVCKLCLICKKNFHDINEFQIHIKTHLKVCKVTLKRLDTSTILAKQTKVQPAQKSNKSKRKQTMKSVRRSRNARESDTICID